MSYLPKNEDNLEGQPQGVTSNDPAAEAPPTQSGGSVGDEGAGGTAAKGSATGTSTQFGSSASKLGDYLSANAPQIGQQADKVAGKFNDQYAQLNQGITNAANQFGQQVQGGYAAQDQNIVNQAISNPTQFTATPENIAKFQAQYNDQYTGPQNFEATQPYSQIQGDVQNAVNQGNLLQNQAGLASYLQGNSKNPTKASSTLDSLLLSGNPDAQKKIQDAGKQFNNLTGQLDTAKTGANQSVQDAQKAAQDAAAYAKGQVDPYVLNFNKSIQDQASQAEQQRQEYNQSLATNQNAANTGRTNLLNAKQGALTPVEQAWAKRGVTNSSSKDTQDSIAQILKMFQPKTDQYDQILGAKMNNNLATTANTATADQYQQAQSLAQLLGQGYQNPLDPSMLSQAGTYQQQSAIPSLEAANTNASNQTQYLKDLSSYYTNPAGGLKTDVSNQASHLLPLFQSGANGYSNFPQSPEYISALQRLAANNYGI